MCVYAQLLLKFSGIDEGVDELLLDIVQVLPLNILNHHEVVKAVVLLSVLVQLAKLLGVRRKAFEVFILHLLIR